MRQLIHKFKSAIKLCFFFKVNIKIFLQTKTIKINKQKPGCKNGASLNDTLYQFDHSELVSEAVVVK